ncbi:DNA polymerase IV [Aurantimonas sp. C2-3-R2]|uniref:DNA polymerase IV n=1 Tax=unclassified Aurantimonas TaxID=2638230 RepID=UPI003FA422A0
MSIPPHLRFCRDCLARDATAGARCRACGSPRVVGHGELAELAIAHIDCDAFYAAVEKRDRPELRQQPVIIGGGHRGVVATACYIARIHGVRSAMPMFRALKLCPDAIVLPPNMAKYAEVGRAVRDMMLAITPLVEPLSIDEAFLDLSGTERLHGQPPALTLARLARDVERDLGISVSVGLSHNKFLAKIASDLEKPRGFSVIGRAETLAFLRDKPISMIWGVGEAMDRSLRRDGLATIGQLQTMDEADLMRRYGRMGQRLFGLSRGIDIRTVDPRGDMKSISAETTFHHDLSTRDQLVPVLRSLSEKVARRLKATDLSASTIVLKMKSADFRTRTRNRKLHDPTRLADRIFETGLALIEKEIDGTRFRLIGIGCADFGPAALADPDDLVDPGAAKRAKAEAALDRLRDRFGQGSIETGYTFRQAADSEVPRPARRHENDPASQESKNGSRQDTRPPPAGGFPVKRL